MDEKTCGTCKHWRPLPVDPGDIRQRRGLCIESPPSVTTIPQQNGQVTLSSYPNLPAEFVACSRHALEVVT